MKTQKIGHASVNTDYYCYASIQLPLLYCRVGGGYKEKRANGRETDAPLTLELDGHFTWVKGEERSRGYICGVKEGDHYVYELRYNEGPGDRAYMEERDRNYLTRILREGTFRQQEPAVWYLREQDRLHGDPDAAQDTRIGEWWSRKLQLPNITELLERAERDCQQVVVREAQIDKLRSLQNASQKLLAPLQTSTQLRLLPQDECRALQSLIEYVSSLKPASLNEEGLTKAISYLESRPSYLASLPQKLALLDAEQAKSEIKVKAKELAAQKTETEKAKAEVATKTKELIVQKAEEEGLVHCTLRCAKCGKIMLDPVMAADGETYEREEIEGWLRDHETSPKTNEVLPNKNLIPNHSTQRALTYFLNAHPELRLTDEVYTSRALKQALITAVQQNGTKQITAIVERDPRLLTKPLVESEDLLLLALKTSPEVLQVVINELGAARFLELPEIKRDSGISCFQIAAIHLGTEGAKVMSAALKFQPKSIQVQFEIALAKNDIRLVTVCLGLGANIEQVDDQGLRPLHRVINHGQQEMLRLLTHQRLEINAADPKGNTALHLAVNKGDLTAIEILFLLLQTRVTTHLNLDVLNLQRLSPLHLALALPSTHPNYLKILTVLVNVGANLELPDTDGDTTLLNAIRTGNLPLCDLLLARQLNPANLEAMRRGENMTSLHLAIELKNRELVQKLLTARANTEALIPPHQDTALLHAIRTHQPELVALLLANKPKPNLEAQDSEGNTALHLAFNLGYFDLIRPLVEAGANIEKKDKSGNTVLLRAARTRNIELIRLLVDRGAKLDAINGSQNNALHIAASQKDEAEDKAIVEYLLERGVTGSTLNAKNERPETTAISAGNKTISTAIYKKIIQLEVAAQLKQSQSTSSVPVRHPLPILLHQTTASPTDGIDYRTIKIDREIGRGSYGVVYQGTWQGSTVAVKQLLVSDLSEQADDELRKEAEMMRQLHHPNIVTLYGVCLEPGHYSLVMEYMPRGSLYAVLHNRRESLSWQIRWNISLDTAKGIMHLHHHQPPIIHRDIKSLNVLLDEHYRAKITDFGLSRVKTETATKTAHQTQPGGPGSPGDAKSVGTLPWMAPELFQLRPRYTTTSDVYATGMVFWEIASRSTPYEGADPTVLKDCVKQEEREEIPPETPQSYAALIKLCWAQKAENRPKIEAVVQDLERQLPEIQALEVKSWHCDPSVKPEASSGTSCHLIEASEKDKQRIAESYQRKPVPGMELGRVRVVYNPDFDVMFSSRLKFLQERKGNPTFVPRWSEENDLAWRKTVIERFEQMAAPYRDQDYPDVEIVLMWHGTRRQAQLPDGSEVDVLDSIFRSGYVNLATTDAGFFGKGIYSTFEAEYAYRVYGQGKYRDNGALLINWIACYSAYPVIDGDMSKFVSQVDPATGQVITSGNYQNYDGHFAPVRSDHPNAVSYYPCRSGEQATYHELVVFESAQCLPRYLVELQPSLLAAPSVTSPTLVPTPSATAPAPAPSTTAPSAASIAASVAGNPLGIFGWKKKGEEKEEKKPVFGAPSTPQ